MLMDGWYLKDSQYEPGKGQSEHGDRIITSIEVKSQDTTFDWVFNQQGVV